MHLNFPEVETIITSKNDFLFSYNAVTHERPEEILLLLNNDMKFDAKFADPLLKHFEDPSVFAVTCKILNWHGTKVTEARRLGKIQKGWFYKGFDFAKEEPCYSIAACGGATAFRKDMFLKLGGFDPLYYPGYYEDLDLSYRAWKMGWKTIYEPRSIVYHRVSASFDKIPALKKHRLLARNHVLFTAKNCGGAGFLLLFLLLMPRRFVTNMLAGNRAFALGMLAALPRLPRAFEWRLRRRIYVGEKHLTDKQIFGLVERPLSNETGLAK